MMEVGHRDSSLLRTRYVYAGNSPKRQPSAISASNFGFGMYKICAP